MQYFLYKNVKILWFNLEFKFKNSVKIYSKFKTNPMHWVLICLGFKAYKLLKAASLKPGIDNMFETVIHEVINGQVIESEFKS
jgi:hypothetical protein